MHQYSTNDQSSQTSILVIEDQPFHVWPLKATLDNMNVDCKIAYNITAVIVALEEKTFDLVKLGRYAA
jgi:DNA-binding NtrC family response regulator